MKEKTNIWDKTLYNLDWPCTYYVAKGEWPGIPDPCSSSSRGPWNYKFDSLHPTFLSFQCGRKYRRTSRKYLEDNIHLLKAWFELSNMLGTFHTFLHFILASSPVGEVLIVHNSSRPWYPLSCKDVWAWWIKKWLSLVSSVTIPARLLQRESPRELLSHDYWLVLTSSSFTFSVKSQLRRSHSPSSIKIHEQIKDTFSAKPPP